MVLAQIGNFPNFEEFSGIFGGFIYFLLILKPSNFFGSGSKFKFEISYSLNMYIILPPIAYYLCSMVICDTHHTRIKLHGCGINIFIIIIIILVIMFIVTIIINIETYKP